MKVMIMGATGFIGKNLLTSLDYDDNEYICLVRKENNHDELLKYSKLSIQKVNYEEDDLSNYLYMIDVVIYLIGQMGGYGIEKEAFEKVNCKLTKKVINAVKHANVKQFIYVSTPGVQGFGKRLCKETEPYAPRNIYEQTKAEAEQLIINCLQETNVNFTILRPDFVYGPEDYRRIKMYKNIRDKKFVLTTSGNSYLHPTYVLDVVQGIKCAIGNQKAYNQIFNISAENDITVKEYVTTIANYFGVPLITINIGYSLSVCMATFIEKICNVFLKKDAFVSKSKIDFLAIDHSTSIDKAQDLLKYKPEYDFKRGFEETMKWCIEKNIIKKED